MTSGTHVPKRPLSHVPLEDLTRQPRRALTGFGQAVRSAATVVEPKDTQELREVLVQANDKGWSVAFRGAGRSYGDASLNAGGLVVSMVKMNRILAWDPATGHLETEPGVSIEDIWRTVLKDGYWPHVVPGTMSPTVGGCVAMNVHGKNHFCQGSFGDHVVEFELMTPQGDLLTCSREAHSDVFHAVIGGFGMLGVTTRIRLALKKVHSGRLSVTGITVRSLESLFTQFKKRETSSDYLVGWLDAFARGQSLGRGVIHAARYLDQGEDPKGSSSLTDQNLPSHFLGIPRGWMWRLVKPWVNNFGMRWINRAKYLLSRLVDRGGRTFYQGHVAFSFLLDYIPRWRDTYGPAGFIQVQPFVPKEAAQEVFKRILERCHETGMVPFLVVVKRHVPDAYLMSHALDGYSLAMDFKVTARTKEKVWAHGQEIGEMAAEAGGKVYFAKDAVADKNNVLKCYGEQTLRDFSDMKNRLDPKGTLSSELSRRILP